MHSFVFISSHVHEMTHFIYYIFLITLCALIFYTILVVVNLYCVFDGSTLLYYFYIFMCCLGANTLLSENYNP